MSKILYTASTASHLHAFHERYIKALRDEGHEVKTLAFGEGVDYNVPFEKKMLSYTNSKCRKQIRKILDTEHFDAVILNTSLAAFHIRLAMRRKNRPRTVNVVHGYLFPEFAKCFRQKTKRLLLLFAEKLLASKTDAIITMNNEDLRIAHKEGLTRGPIIHTFGMGISAPEFTKAPGEIRRENGAEGAFILAFAGELSGRKNQFFLISALPKVIERVPNAVLWLLGDGAERASLENEARTLGIGERVIFFGRRKNPSDYMRECDAYVSASRSEGLPFNIVEALSCGAAVIATRVKGHTDILESGAGFLFEPGSTEEFAEYVAGIANGTVSADRDKIRETVRLFSEQEVFDKTYKAIKEAAGI